MSKTDELKAAILARLAQVIDPETGVDVLRMQLIQDLTVDEQGLVSYKFRPSSFLCPIAVTLALDIQHAVAEVEGVTGQNVEVIDFIMSEQLNEWLKNYQETLKK